MAGWEREALWTIVCLLLLHLVVVVNGGQGEEASSTDFSSDRARDGSCSYASQNCVTGTTCVDNEARSRYICYCPLGYRGNGYVEGMVTNATGCTLPGNLVVCKSNQDCHHYATCVPLNHTADLSICVCADSFTGRGGMGENEACKDINECLSSPCVEHAICENSPGSYTCKCDSSNNFEGDGFTLCNYMCFNHDDCDVNGRCSKGKCECNNGYTGSGRYCEEVDPCTNGQLNCPTDSQCQNLSTGYECVCRNGYHMKDGTCQKQARTCHELLQTARRRFRSGRYEVDLDGEGPGEAMEVDCVVIGSIAVTEIAPLDSLNSPQPIPKSATEQKVEYPGDLTDFINNSEFCSQEVWLQCTEKFDGGMIQWKDVQGNLHSGWGANKPDMCACGLMRKCINNCTCGFGEEGVDDGLILNREQLPVSSVIFPDTSNNAGNYRVGKLRCGPQPFDIPRNCHEAKEKYRVKHDKVIYIDIDGDGPRDPFLVLCNQDDFSHVGITEIPPDQLVVHRTGAEGDTVEYMVDGPDVEALINGSAFCSQKIEYECSSMSMSSAQNLKGLKGRSASGGYSITTKSNTFTYFPGGSNDTSDSCPCGLTNSCQEMRVKCSCELGGVPGRKDIGLIINKKNLPVLRIKSTLGDNFFRIGPLQCSEKQFGIEASCEKYRQNGVTDSYSYYVDPDGPMDNEDGNVEPFLVECEIDQYQGVTVINNENGDGLDLSTGTEYSIKYMQVTTPQVDALKVRSTGCIQNITFSDCGGSTIDITKVQYNGMNALADLMSDHCDDGICKCDSAYTVLTREQLPIASVQGEKQRTKGTVKVGSLKCVEVPPDCSSYVEFLSEKGPEGESKLGNKQITIDPDGAGGDDPFIVKCAQVTTIISRPTAETPTIKVIPKDPGPVRMCQNLTYTDWSGNVIPHRQLHVLVGTRKMCTQTLTLTCANARATGNVYYRNCGGEKFTKFVSSDINATCSCGAVGTCIGGLSDQCNCDSSGDKKVTDKNKIFSNDRLPVCEVCMELDGIEGGVPDFRYLRFDVSELRCSRRGGLGKLNCQKYRNFNKFNDLTEDKEVQLQYKTSSGEFIIIGCIFYAFTNFGEMIIRPNQSVYEVDRPGEPGNITITVTYMGFNSSSQAIDEANYCTQDVLFFCADDVPDLSGTYGMYSMGRKLTTADYELREMSEDEVGKVCRDARFHSTCNRCGMSPKRITLTNKDRLPLTSFFLPEGTRATIAVTDTACAYVEKDCHAIQQNDRKRDNLSDGTYLIDPDQAGPLPPFRVLCEFNENVGVTKVPVNPDWSGQKKARGEGGVDGQDFSFSNRYPTATPEQIQSLVQNSEFCWQGVKYECEETPLDSSSSLLDRVGHKLTSFGTADNSAAMGCACNVLGTCKVKGYACNCNGAGSMVDQGFVTDQDVLPITGFNVTVAPGGSGSVSLTDVRCAPTPVDIPKDCAEAFTWNSRHGIDYTVNGEFLISPDPDKVRPFLVYCDFTRDPGNRPVGAGGTCVDQYPQCREWADRGECEKNGPLMRSYCQRSCHACGPAVTIIKPHPMEGEPVGENNTDVDYHGPSDEQLLALMTVSTHCYQPVKVDCYAASFMEAGVRFWAMDAKAHAFWSSTGDRNNATCTCGALDLCGGTESHSKQLATKCNCDIGDEVWRSDAAILDITDTGPITSLLTAGVFDSSKGHLNLTVGDVFCSQEPLVFNECSTGFEECDARAQCVDTEQNYRCLCQEGWQGRIFTQPASDDPPMANGRQCIDDDECMLTNECQDYNSDCVNTPGAYHCDCHAGYRHAEGEVYKCIDIDECAEGSDKCDDNANCFNTEGSHRCRCKKGYRGSGKTDDCHPVGLCSCFGDPHCTSFDGRWNHYQGRCSYVMAENDCDSDLSSGENKFRVSNNNWDRGIEGEGGFAWIKEVIVEAHGKTIVIGQELLVTVDGEAKRSYRLLSENKSTVLLQVTVIGFKVEVYTNFGLEVQAIEGERVTVVLPTSFNNTMCGLCGNYNNNPADDWIVGPQCPSKQDSQTTNEVLFGNSWTVDSDACPVDCNPPTPNKTCNNEEHHVKQICSRLFNDTSPFITGGCLQKMPETDVEGFKFACQYDLCHTDDISKSMCEVAEAMGAYCLQLLGDGFTWRSSNICGEKKCEANEEFKVCGPTSEPTCLSSEPMPIDQCQENCYCLEGYVRQGEGCVKAEDCGCLYDGSLMSVGDSQLVENCSKMVKCADHEKLEVTSHQCGDNQECQVGDDGVMTCEDLPTPTSTPEPATPQPKTEPTAPQRTTPEATTTAPIIIDDMTTTPEAATPEATTTTPSIIDYMTTTSEATTTATSTIIYGKPTTPETPTPEPTTTSTSTIIYGKPTTPETPTPEPTTTSTSTIIYGKPTTPETPTPEPTTTATSTMIYGKPTTPETLTPEPTTTSTSTIIYGKPTTPETPTPEPTTTATSTMIYGKPTTPETLTPEPTTTATSTIIYGKPTTPETPTPEPTTSTSTIIYGKPTTPETPTPEPTTSTSTIIYGKPTTPETPTPEPTTTAPSIIDYMTTTSEATTTATSTIIYGKPTTPETATPEPTTTATSTIIYGKPTIPETPTPEPTTTATSTIIYGKPTTPETPEPSSPSPSTPATTPQPDAPQPDSPQPDTPTHATPLTTILPPSPKSTTLPLTPKSTTLPLTPKSTTLPLTPKSTTLPLTPKSTTLPPTATTPQRPCEDGVCTQANTHCVEGVCVCDTGFTADCHHCVDMNECETGTHTCAHLGQKCVNTHGSFLCVCQEGFVMRHGFCHDIDECENPATSCGLHAECRNLLGTYECECCMGYSKSGEACRRDERLDTVYGAPGQECCACTGRCDEPEPVCGTDGETYPNYAAMVVRGCRDNRTIEVGYQGYCEETCNTVSCEKPYETCAKDEVSGKAICYCPDCSGVASENSEPVCATNGRIYASKCIFELIMCLTVRKDVYLERSLTACGDTDGTVDQWSEWGACDNPCGKGNATRSRLLHVPYENRNYTVTEAAVCYSTCAEGPCKNDTCHNPGQVCEVGSETGEGTCVCPDCAGQPDTPVCALVGDIVRTYGNQCMMRQAACQLTKNYQVLEYKACEDNPPDCAVVKNYAILEDADGCITNGTTDIGFCYGSCAHMGECCRPDFSRPHSATSKGLSYTCPNGTSHTAQETVIDACKCLQEPQH